MFLRTVHDKVKGSVRLKTVGSVGSDDCGLRPNRGTLNLMKQSLDGTSPEEVAKFDQDDLFDFDYSADGQFAVTRGVWNWDVVLINGLN